MQLVPDVKFDGDAFFAALDAQRQARRLTWKKVAEEAGVSASTLTRMSQGRRPDVDSLAALSVWAGLDTDEFMRSASGATERGHAEPLARVMTHLRADPNLSREAASALEAIVKTAYERMRKERAS